MYGTKDGMTRRRVLGFWCNGTKTEKKLGRKYLRQREREEQTRLGITDANSLPSFPTFSHPQILLMYTSFFPFLPSLFFTMVHYTFFPLPPFLFFVGSFPLIHKLFPFCLLSRFPFSFAFLLVPTSFFPLSFLPFFLTMSMSLSAKATISGSFFKRSCLKE